MLVEENYLTLNMTNRMRSFHTHLATEFIMFESKVQLAKCIANSININGTEVQRSDIINYLEAWLDQNLTLTECVNRKCQNAMMNH